MARLLACVWVVTTGCSFVLTSAPAPPPANPDCTLSRLPPAVDVGIAITALFLAGLSHGGGALGSEEKGPEYGGLAVMGLATASAIYGFVRTSQCRQAYDARAYAPIPYPAPPPPFRQ